VACDLVVRCDGVAVLTLDRAPVNAVDLDMVVLLTAHCRRVGSEAGIRALVIESALGRFCAGADLRWVQGCLDHPAAIAEFTAEMNRLFDGIAGLPVPTVAAVDGAALGGGFELALACDIRVASPRATFGFPESGVGLYPAGGGLPRLAAVAGRGVALDLALTGRTLTQPEAVRLGIAQYESAAGTATKVAAGIAAGLAQRPPAALRAVKERFGADVPRVSSAAEVTLMTSLLGDAESRAAVAAFGSR
jgi:enoyl-CoA hydratase